MPSLPSVLPAYYPTQMQDVATLASTPLWRTLALSLAAVLCLLLYLRRRRHPAGSYHNEQPAPVFEKHGNMSYPSVAPSLSDYNAPINHHFSNPDASHFSSFNFPAAAPPPLPLPTIRRHSCHVAQPPPFPPTTTHYTRRISADSIQPARSIRGSIMRGGSLAPGVRRNQWTIEIR